VTSVEPSQCAATLLQHQDGRVIFFIPWDGKWLLGTTDSLLEGTPDRWSCPGHDREYLLGLAAHYLTLDRPEERILELFCGIRTLPVRRHRNGSMQLPNAWREDPFASPFYRRTWSRHMAALSREAVVEESAAGLLSIYGGKFTTYRSLSERVGDAVAARLGISRPSGTRRHENWFLRDLADEADMLVSQAALRQS
jgi:glycerol-3-phosphate dehydrogenase